MEDAVVRGQAIAAARTAADHFPVEELEMRLRRPRTLFSFVLSLSTGALTIAALAPLFSVLYMLVSKGMRSLTFETLTSLPPAQDEIGGGFGNAILGTLLMVGIATIITVPLGIMAAVYLAETGPDTKLANLVRFGAKTLSGFPSILAGVLVYGGFVVLTGSGSAVAGSIALAVLMLPTILLTSEDAIRMVPAKIREAAIGMGATKTQLIWYIMLPTALPGILTGVMLAIARAAGETAPLLYTANFSNYWIWTGGTSVMKPTSSLSVLIYSFSTSNDNHQKDLAWAAALVMVVLVLTFNLIGQSLSPRNG